MAMETMMEAGTTVTKENATRTATHTASIARTEVTTFAAPRKGTGRTGV